MENSGCRILSDGNLLNTNCVSTEEIMSVLYTYSRLERYRPERLRPASRVSICVWVCVLGSLFVSAGMPHTLPPSVRAALLWGIHACLPSCSNIRTQNQNMRMNDSWDHSKQYQRHGLERTLGDGKATKSASCQELPVRNYKQPFI